MINCLGERIFELFHIQMSDESYSKSLFELGLSVEQVLYFLFDLTKNKNFQLSKYYEEMRICSLNEIYASMRE